VVEEEAGQPHSCFFMRAAAHATLSVAAMLCPWPPPQEAMFGEEEAGQPHSNKEAAVMIAYEAVSCGLLSEMVSYLGALVHVIVLQEACSLGEDLGAG